MNRAEGLVTEQEGLPDLQRPSALSVDGPQLVEQAREMQPDGLLLNSPRPNLLRFMPALNVTREEIDQMIGMLRTLLKALA